MRTNALARFDFVEESELVEHEKRPHHQASGCDGVVPVQPVAEVSHREDAKDAERNHLRITFNCSGE